MCVSIAPTNFAKTITGLYEASDGRHVIYYQNMIASPRAKSIGTAGQNQTRQSRRRSAKAASSATPNNWEINNTADGNALVIPLMTDDFKSIELLAEVADFPNMLADIRIALQPVTRGGTRRGGVAKDSLDGQVIIQQYDIYTLVLASRASLIPEAVKRVPARKRPPLEQALFDKLEQWYECPFVVACFNNNDAGESKPIAYAYAPRYPDKFMIYTLDGHDGKEPDLNGTVELDHCVFASSYRMNSGNAVHYRDIIHTRGSSGDFMPKFVVGENFTKGTHMINGDFLLNVDDVADGVFEPYRVLPPKAPKRKPLKLAEAYR